MLVGAVYGGMVLAIYPIGVAHTNDFPPPEDAIAATGGLLLAFGIGAMPGPIAAAWLKDTDRKSVVQGTGLAGTVDVGRCRMIQKTTEKDVQPSDIEDTRKQYDTLDRYK